MKTLMLAAVLLLSPALMAEVPESPDDAKVNYTSWCEGDKVTTWDDGDLPMTQWDCYEMTEKGICVETATKEDDVTVVTASCQ